MRHAGAALLVGILLRLTALALHPPLDIDETRYLVTAHHLRHGMGYADWRGREVDILPLHPALTALLGRDPASLEQRGRAVALAAGILSLIGFSVLARRLFGDGAAVIATWLVAIHPWLVRASCRPQPETLYVLWTTLALLALAPIMEGIGRAIHWGSAGLLFGLAYLSRPEGFLVGLAGLAVAVVRGRAGGMRVRAGTAVFVLGLFAVSLPYLVWLREAAGRWTLTGKSADVFFIGQAMHENAGQPPSADAYLALKTKYGSVLGFVTDHPLQTAARALRFGWVIFGWILPRALGPLGLVGLCVAYPFGTLSNGSARVPWWPILPAFVLPLMVFACPEERVVGAAIPFVLLTSSAGLVRAWDALQRRWPSHRGALMCGGVILATLPWLHPGLRAVAGGRAWQQQPEREVVETLTRGAPLAARIVSNSPVVSFYARDPALFGPPGHYQPIESPPDCVALMSEMRLRRASVAVVEFRDDASRHATSDRNCPLALTDVVTEGENGRRFEVWRDGV